MNRKEKIIGFMGEDAYIPLMYDELKTVLCVPKESEDEFSHLMDELVNEGTVVKTKKKRFMLAKKAGLYTGQLKTNRRGFGFLIHDGEDIFISSSNFGGAISGDTVMIKITKKSVGERHSEGEVVKILKRKNSEFVGRYEKNRNFGFVIIDDKKINHDIFISKQNTMNSKDGDKVVVQIIKWPTETKKAEGRIIEIIGHKDDKNVNVMSVIRQHGIDMEFNKKTIQEAENISGNISENELLKNRSAPGGEGQPFVLPWG